MVEGTLGCPRNTLLYLRILPEDFQAAGQGFFRIDRRQGDAKVAGVFMVTAEKAVGMVDPDAVGQKFLFDLRSPSCIGNGQPAEKAVGMAAVATCLLYTSDAADE